MVKYCSLSRDQRRGLGTIRFGTPALQHLALPKEMLGGQQGALASEALRAKAQRGSKLIRVGLAEPLVSRARKPASDTSVQGEELCLWAAGRRQQLSRGLRNDTFGIGHLKCQLKLKIHHIPL